jgi:acetyltransferase-like isoleucine patch superfamily enzyme
MSSNYQKMLDGGSYYAPEMECIQRAGMIAEKLNLFNATPLSDQANRHGLLKEMFLSYVPSYIMGPLTLEYGHIEMAGGVFVNWDCMFIDNARITIQKNVAIGPRCLFVTASHSLDPMQRAQLDEAGFACGGYGISAPIVIEEHVWIAGNVTVLPGVTIGARSTIGAGSVVTRNIPPDVLAFGNPCRVHKSLT